MLFQVLGWIKSVVLKKQSATNFQPVLCHQLQCTIMASPIATNFQPVVLKKQSAMAAMSNEPLTWASLVGEHHEALAKELNEGARQMMLGKDERKAKEKKKKKKKKNKKEAKEKAKTKENIIKAYKNSSAFKKDVAKAASAAIKKQKKAIRHKMCLELFYGVFKKVLLTCPQTTGGLHSKANRKMINVFASTIKTDRLWRFLKSG